MNGPTLKFCALAATLVAVGCGAPTKSASQVASLFTGDATSLQDKETTVCTTLQNREDAPTLKGMTIDLGGCQDSGLAALDYKNTNAFYFLGLDGGIPAQSGGKTDDVFHKAVRSEIWLNKTLLDLATSVSGLMQNGQNAGSGAIGNIALPDSSSGSFGGLVKPTITVTEQPTFDIANFLFSMKIHISLTGAVKADHDIAIDGKLINNAIAVTIKTTADRTFEQSIIKNFQAVILIIPHASDVYMDLFVDLNIYNFGLDTLVHDQVNQFLSTGLKSAIDKAMQL